VIPKLARAPAAALAARKQFHDESIASRQLVQEKLAWMISELTKARLLVLQVGRLKDQKKVKHQHISMAKRNNVWMALECARMSRDILGANGVADEYPIFHHMANLESVKTYEGDSRHPDADCWAERGGD